MPAFNEDELLASVDDDWEFLSETVQVLVTNGRALMDEIRRAAAAGDGAALGAAGHTLKGMISNFCAPAAHKSALAVETIGKAGDLSAAPPAVAALDEQLTGLIAALTDFLKTRA